MSAPIASLPSPTALTASKSASSGAPASATQGLFGPGASAAQDAASQGTAGAATTDQAGQDGAATQGATTQGSTGQGKTSAADQGSAKTSDKDDATTSPFADALAAALGLTPQVIIQPTPTPSTGGSTGADGMSGAIASVTGATAGNSGLIASTPAGAVTASLIASAQTDDTDTADAPPTTSALIAVPANLLASATTKNNGPAVPQTAPPTAAPAVAAQTPAAQASSVQTPPVQSQVAQAPAQTAESQPVAAPSPPMPTVAAQTTPPQPAAVDAATVLQAAVAANGVPPTKAPVQQPPSTNKTAAAPASGPSKAAAATVAKPVVEVTQAATPVKAEAIETVTDKALASSAGDTADDPAAAASPDKAPDASLLAAAQTVQTAQVQLQTAEAPKVTPQTVAHLAAQISSNVDGKSTRFDVTLNPAGLGKVDVSVQIGAGGDMTAQLNFANPDAAAQMQSRAAELHTALQQAGFDPSKTTLSFNSSDSGNFGGAQQGFQDAQNQQSQGQPSWTGRAFTSLSDQSDEAVAAPSWARRTAGGVDVRI